jgi:hypothetical protein
MCSEGFCVSKFDWTTFANVASYQVDSATLSGAPIFVDEIAEGASGLQYISDGNWQINWNTAKSDARKCRVMAVEFNDGTTSPVAMFKFN